MGSVRTPIIERPRPSPRHRRAQTYTLNPEEPTNQLAMLDKAEVWQPAYDGDGQIRSGAFVAEATGLLNLASWPEGMRVILGKERPHPGAQLRITDHDGNSGHRVRDQHHPRPAR